MGTPNKPGKGSKRKPKGNILVNTTPTPVNTTGGNLQGTPTTNTKVTPTVTPTHTTTTPNPVVVPPVQNAVFVPTTKSTKNLRGNSTIPNPVGNYWVTLLNLCFGTNGVPVVPTPTRNHLYNVGVNMGVTHLTVRTQLQLFYKQSNGFTTVPTKLPKGVYYTPTGN